jgi:hypothetical protein
MRVTLIHDPWDAVLRQTPGGAGAWGPRWTFASNGGEPRECDAVVVCERMAGALPVVCPAGQTVFVTWEPPSVRRYDAKFLRQFAAIVSPNADLPHPNVIRVQPGLPWTVGYRYEGAHKRFSTLDYDQLAGMRPPKKTKLISVICSNKAMTEGHRQRLRLLEHLREALGAELDVFGNGFNPVEDKWDAILPYRYHIVMENSEIDDYWTEKLSDAYLGFAYPIYSGCTNIGRYFGAEAMRTFNRLDPEGAVRVVREAIGSDVYGRSTGALAEARAAVLDRHNLFSLLVGVLDGLPTGPARRVTLRPEEDFTSTAVQRIKRRVRSMLAVGRG